jgi:Ni,Fe-hydrogenase III small subunit
MIFVPIQGQNTWERERLARFWAGEIPVVHKIPDPKFEHISSRGTILMIRIYRINTGSCGACDGEINTIANTASEIEWAHSPQDADVLLVTGPITHTSKAAFLSILRDVGTLPLLAIGRCAIDGHPFGKGGVQALEDVVVPLNMRVDGCPPNPDTLLEVLRHHAL